MLDSNVVRKIFLFTQRGSSLVEYAVLLAFIAVLAVVFSPEHLPKYAGKDSSELTGENLSTTIYFIFLKVKVLLMHAVNSL